MATRMATPHQLQLHRLQLTAVDQLRRRQPGQADHLHFSQHRRPTVDQLTRAALWGKGENPPSTGGKGASSYLEVPEWKESWVDQSWRGEPNACKNESWVNQSWDSNAPETQACTRTNQSTS